ncbi:isoprenylcysteine carboxyl methyltransferase (ICMT) family protein YpbQ [Azospirillum canadense]|nr:isoprenylcysteine carboxyl methyltransferase (ICMT) family protein YpbQ [Azospirillum canadense]
MDAAMEPIVSLLNTVYWQPWAAIMSSDPWTSNLVMAILLMLKLVFGGWVVAKGGRSPLWALVMLINGADILAMWLYAYIRWPFVDRKPAEAVAVDAATD